MTAPIANLRTIAGRGGGKGGGSGGGGGGIEAPNSLKSKQIARIVDLISEGPIRGVMSLQNVWFDGVPLQNSDGSLNVTSLEVAQVTGMPAQPVIKGFAQQQAETAVGVLLKSGIRLVRSIVDPNVDRCRITVSVPALQWTNKNTGDVHGTTVDFEIHVQSNGGGWQKLGRHQIAGKTNTRYQRAIVFTLPGSGPWDIGLVRQDADSTTLELQNDLYWDSFTAIIDARVNYTLSACFGIIVDAEQFQTIPKRTYLVDGLYVVIPSNYNPFTRVFTGVWDGTWAYNWTNNPAFIFFDLIRNNRYGVGDFIAHDDVDKWALYKIAQWCDGLVPNGRGGSEPRFICNTVISSQQEAFDLINSLAAVFRGFAYWAGGMMVPVADMPADPVGQYTNANVVDGTFNYAGADIRARHTMAQVRWNDPDNLGEPRVTIVEDQQAISRYGIQKTDVIAIGCTSESQAVRTGRWTLFTEINEAETVTFSTGLDTAWARPGDIIQIADINIAGKRRGGRVAAGSTASIVNFDAPVEGFTPGLSVYLSCIIGEGIIETRQGGSLSLTSMQVSPPFSAAPLPDTVFVVASSDLEPTLWRAITVREPETGIFEITALKHHPGKWDYIENNIVLTTPDISNIGAVPPVTGLNAMDYLVALSSVSIGVRMLISWQSLAPHYEVAFRPVNGNWTRIRTDQTALDIEAVEGQYQIQVTPINALGRRGTTVAIAYTVIGRTALPADPRNFRIQSVQGVAMFQWAPATDLDVIIGGSFEMRFSPRTTGVTWASANTVLTSIPGTATSVELPYRSGTYLLRTRDIIGLFSRNAAAIVTTGPDTAYRPFYRICEQPEWLGGRLNVEIRQPQNWLVLGVTGGVWDDQTEALQPGGMDAWPDVDILPIGPSGQAEGLGTYTFDKRIDMGGVFPVRLTVDMLAFPYIEADLFVDERPGNVDDWQDWDNASEDGAGMVTIRVRQTDDDPALTSARWTEWTQFISGEYTGRAFEFQAMLNAPPGQNVAIEELCILADISAKQDSGADVPWLPSKMHIDFDVKFYLVPSISIAIQEGVVGDTFRITNKTREGFDLELFNGAGAIITAARTFDWIAAGF